MQLLRRYGSWLASAPDADQRREPGYPSRQPDLFGGESREGGIRGDVALITSGTGLFVTGGLAGANTPVLAGDHGTGCSMPTGN